MTASKKALLLIGSPRCRSTSRSLGVYLMDHLRAWGWDTSDARLATLLRSPGRTRALLAAVADADLVLLSTPLYVDCLPAPAIEALEQIAAQRGHSAKGRPHFAAIVNAGFPEASQGSTALAICRRFAAEAGFEWAGGLSLGGGPIIDGRPLEKTGNMTRNVRAALKLAADALAREEMIPEEAVALMARPLSPFALYRFFGNLGWWWQAWKNGCLRRLGARPHNARADSSAQ